MRRIIINIIILTMVLLAGFITNSPAQQLARFSEKEMSDLLRQIAKDSDRFHDSVNAAFDQTGFNDPTTKSNMKRYIKDFELATVQLKNRFDNDRSASASVQNVLERAIQIDGFMTDHLLIPRVQGDWGNLRVNLDLLAKAYQVSWSRPSLSNRPYRVTDEQVKGLLQHIKVGSENFCRHLKAALEISRFNNSAAENNIRVFINEFVVASERLENSFTYNQSGATVATEVLGRALLIDGFMRCHSYQLTPIVIRDWEDLRKNLKTLAQAYRVTWIR
jgi:hypothetical protein